MRKRCWIPDTSRQHPASSIQVHQASITLKHHHDYTFKINTAFY